AAVAARPRRGLPDQHHGRRRAPAARDPVPRGGRPRRPRPHPPPGGRLIRRRQARGPASHAEPAVGSVAGVASTGLQPASGSTLQTSAGGRLVQGYGGPNEGLQSLLVQLVAFVEVDGAPDVAFETGGEDP